MNASFSNASCGDGDVVQVKRGHGEPREEGSSITIGEGWVCESDIL